MITGIAVLILVIIFIAAEAESEVVIATSMGLASGGTLLFLVVDRFVQKRKVRKLKDASLRAEVHSLKSQINPHFFFNTLNNLYGLTVEKSELAPDVVLKLSDMLRYTIYEGEKDQVLLKDEIAYLDNFIELHKIRFHRTLDIKFERFLEDDNVTVPPLLFINLLENAFKHGAESLTEDAYIHLKLISMSDNILFEVKNNFEPQPTNNIGIGLKNLERRLALLFPEKHKLVTGVESDNKFKAKLKIDVS